MSDDPTEQPLDAATPHEGDVLPADLDPSQYVGPYTFPDIKRRRVPGFIYLGTAVVLLALWLGYHDGGVFVNRGTLAAAIGFAVVGAYHLLAGWPLRIREVDALASASREVGFAVGHASAQLGWRGLRSRPTWRILLYSADEPPAKRGLVRVDGLDGAVVEHMVEDNPEDWAEQVE
jgi:hypothetical protein